MTSQVIADPLAVSGLVVGAHTDVGPHPINDRLCRCPAPPRTRSIRLRLARWGLTALLQEK
jgi:hypothetical protein